MKRALAGVGIFLIGATAGALLQRYELRRVWEFTPGSQCYDLQVLAQSWRSNEIDGVWAFVGDSFIAGLAASRVTNAENFGVNGDTVAGVTHRLSRLDLSRVRGVVIEVGTNDLAFRRKDFGAAYAAMLERLPARVVAVAIPPTADGKRQRVDLIQAANRSIEEVCAAHNGCRYLDLYRDLADDTGHLRAQFDVGDGIHLSREGYERWLAALAPLVRDP